MHHNTLVTDPDQRQALLEKSLDMPFSLAKLTSHGDETMVRKPPQRHAETQWDAVD